jgi:hypothetical protein
MADTGRGRGGFGRGRGDRGRGRGRGGRRGPRKDEEKDWYVLALRVLVPLEPTAVIEGSPLPNSVVL